MSTRRDVINEDRIRAPTDALVAVDRRETAREARSGDRIAFDRDGTVERHPITRVEWEGNVARLVFEPVPGATTFLTDAEVDRRPDFVVERRTS